MPTYDIAPEFGIPYEIIGPDGSRISFNDPTDPDDVGVLTSLQGLDSAEVRESGEALIAFDGGVQGPNYYGRRPIVIEGLVYGHDSSAERQDKLGRIMRATNAMRSDCKLRWTPTASGGAFPVELTLRRQQPLKIDGGWNKTFQISMVAADPRIYAQSAEATYSATIGSVLHPNNSGNTETYPVYTIMGPVTNPVIHNAQSGRNIALIADIDFDHAIFIDTLARTVNRATRGWGSRVNYFKYPSFEDAPGTVGFTVPDAFTALSVVTQPSGVGPIPHGSKCLRLNRTGTTAQQMNIDYLNAFADPGNLPGSPSSPDRFTVAFDYAGPSAALTGTLPRVTFSWKNSSNALISTSDVFGSGAAVHPNSTWQRFKAVSGAPPSGTAKVDVRISFIPNHTLADYYIDGVTMEWSVYSRDPAGTINIDGAYFDGANPVMLNHLSAWHGSPDASVSESFNTEIRAASGLTPVYQYVDFTNTRWSGLVPGSNDISLTSSAVQVGNSMRVDWKHAWL